MIKTYNIALDIDVDDIVDNILQYIDDELGEKAGHWIPEEIYNEMVSDILARAKERAVIWQKEVAD